MPEFVKKLMVLGHFRWSDGNIFLHGERAVIFRSAILAEMQNGLYSTIGWKKTDELFRMMGKSQAESAFRRYGKNGIEATGRDAINEEPMIRMGRLFLEITGWGIGGRYIRFGGKNEVVGTIRNSPIALSYIEKYGKTGDTVCHFLTGILEGGFSHISSSGGCASKIRFTEKSCVAQGMKECTFIGRAVQATKARAKAQKTKFAETNLL